MARYETVIGLEVHAQLKTNTKIFCNCSTQFGVAANENVCPVCSGMPGVLPVLNKKVVEYAVKMGLSINCQINLCSVFARKNYFYPDLPKGYQISQFELPICEHGHVDIVVNGEKKRIGVTRIHMEEDAGKNIHRDNASYVDLNRAGVPLIEIVSEPDMRSAEEAVAYLKELRAILLYLGICDGNMEEGSFRCDANISIRPVGQEELGTRTELKNINSFRNVQKAINYEVERQIDLIEDGEKVIQQTRLFDTAKGQTFAMRSKEEAHDYRYYPDPDLRPVQVRQEDVDTWKKGLPELPDSRCKRFQSQYGLDEKDAVLLISEKEIADYFEEAVKTADAKKLANWIAGDLFAYLKQQNCSISECKLSPQNLSELVELIEKGTISNKIAQDIFATLCSEGVSPAKYVADKGLVQLSDTDELEGIVASVLAENPAEVEAYRAGKTKLISFFVGQIMRKTKGKGNPSVINELLEKQLQ